MDSIASVPTGIKAGRNNGIGTTAVAQVSLLRLYLLRVGYLFVGVGLAVVKWPLFIHHDTPWTLFEGVVNCMLAAMSVLALLGLKYPLKMLPILLFETAWKLILLAVVALPAALDGEVDNATGGVIFSCSLIVIILAVIPWRYVVAEYLTKSGDRWR